MIFKKHKILEQMPLLQIKDYYRLSIFCSKLMCKNSFKSIKDDILEIDWKLVKNDVYLNLIVEGDFKDCPNFGVINGKIKEKNAEYKYMIEFIFSLNDLEEIAEKFVLLDTLKKFNL